MACDCAAFNVLPSALYSLKVPSSGAAWPTTTSWSWADATYPDAGDLTIRQAHAIDITAGAGPNGENVFGLNAAASNADKDLSGLWLTPNVLGTTTFSGHPTVQWGGFDASANRLSFDFKIDSSWIAAVISAGLTKASRIIEIGSDVFGGADSWILLDVNYDPAFGRGPSGGNLVGRYSLTRRSPNATTSNLDTSLPMDTWITVNVDWKCGTVVSGSPSADGCLRVWWRPSGGGPSTQLFSFVDAALRLNSTLLTEPNQDAYSGGGSPPSHTEADYNYASYINVGNLPTGGSLIGQYANLTLASGTFKKVGSFVMGAYGTVQSTRSFLVSLDDNPNVLNEPGKMKVCGNLEVTGNVEVGGELGPGISAMLDALDE